MPIAIPPGIREWADRSLRRRAVGLALFSIVCFVGLAAIVVSWIDEGRENDFLRDNGVEVDAVIVDVIWRINTPRTRATIVEFAFDGTINRGRLNHGTSSHVGETIRILVDPEDSTSIRATNEANISLLVPMSAFLALVLGGLCAHSAYGHGRARRLLHRLDFSEGGLIVDHDRIRSGVRHRTTLVVAGERHEIRGKSIGTRRGATATPAVWAADGRRVLVLVPAEKIVAFGLVAHSALRNLAENSPAAAS